MNIDTAVNSGENLKRDYTQMEPVKVIARYVNGKVLKGYTHDFFPNKHILRISPSIDESLKEGTKIQMLTSKQYSLCGIL